MEQEGKVVALREQLLTQLPFIREKSVLMVRCNTKDERSALNRLAYHQGFSTRAIEYPWWKNNYLYRFPDGTCDLFSLIDWKSDYGCELDYYEYDSGEDNLIYCHDHCDRWEDLRFDENVYGLDYNAVVIYPKHIHAEFKDKKEFLERKSKVTKPWTRVEKGGSIHTQEKEEVLINEIYNPKYEWVDFSEVLIISSDSKKGEK